MKHMIRKSALLLLPLLFVALSSAAQASRAERMAQFEKFAEAPVTQFRYFQLSGFETLTDNTVAVWAGVGKVYLIKLRPPCTELNYSDTIHLNSSETHLFSQRFDTVGVGESRCMVESIRPIDYKAMRSASTSGKDSPD